MIFCKDCRYLGSERAYQVQKRFVDKFTDSTKVVYDHYLAARTPICVHPSCFDEKITITPMEKRVDKVRLQGQAQLNHFNDCIFYEPKPEPPKVLEVIPLYPDPPKPFWWKFWKRR